VANLSLLMGAEGFAKQYRPETDLILWGTKLLEYDKEEQLIFTAPAPGDYPYICTFPGHAIIMRGVMHVVNE
jgi:azurin